MPSPALGIDLGTTCSAIARIDEMGRTTMFRNVQGDLLIPSAVYFEDEEVVFGSAAKQAAGTQPERVAECVKRDLGKATYSRAIGGELLPCELIEGYLLKRLHDDAVGKNEPKAGAVLSVPGCFNQAQRRAMREAGQIAGLDLLGTITDTLAAALTIAEQQGYLNPQVAAEKSGSRLLVFDLGGGKLDVAIIEVKPGSVRTRASAGDTRLGGRDWDARLADLLASRFSKQFNCDPRYDIKSVWRLLQSAEEMKHTLSARQQARVRVERAGDATDIAVTRQEFQELSAELIARAKAVTERVLGSASLAWRDLSHLLLVGGATRMPMISSMLETLTGMKAVANIHPDEAVARGAALYAERLLAERERRKSHVQFAMTDLSAHSLGVEWHNPEAGHAENVVIIPRGTELPTSTISKVATQSADQTSIVVQLLEGESRNAEECSRVVQAEVRDLPVHLPRHYPVEIEYRFTAEGWLEVSARLQNTGQRLTVDLKREAGLSDNQFAEFKALVASQQGLKAIRALVVKYQADRPTLAPATAPVRMPALPRSHALEESEFDGHADVVDESLAIDEKEVQTRRRATSALLKKDRNPGRKLLILLVGWLTSAALGLSIGYYILVILRPELNWLQLELPGVSPPQSSEPLSAGSR